MPPPHAKMYSVHTTLARANPIAVCASGVVRSLSNRVVKESEKRTSTVVCAKL